MHPAALDDALHYIDSWLEYQFPLMQVPSLSVAAAHRDEVVFTKALGVADLQSGRTATTETPYRIASHSKMFTAVAILQLQEMGKLSLNDPVVQHLDWVRGHSDSRWQKITIRQLLSHSAGVVRDGTASGFWTLSYPFPGTKKLKQEILEANLVIDPDKVMKYSNHGFGLLGMIVEATSGNPYNDYVLKHIIQKLDLRHTTPELTGELETELAVGYTARYFGKQLPIDHSDTRALSAATGFCSTPSDICRFVRSLYDPKDSRLLSNDSKKEMMRMHRSNTRPHGLIKGYGLGLEIDEIDSREVYGHSGGFPGTKSLTRFDPKSDILVSVANNDSGPASAFIVRSVFHCIDWFSEHYVKNPAHDLTKFSGRFATLWGVTDTLGYGNTIIRLFPSLPLDLKNAMKLKRINNETLEVIDDDSLGNLGEQVKYLFDENGEIMSTNWSGNITLPLEKYREKLENLDRIRLP